MRTAFHNFSSLPYRLGLTAHQKKYSPKMNRKKLTGPGCTYVVGTAKNEVWLVALVYPQKQTKSDDNILQNDNN